MTNNKQVKGPKRSGADSRSDDSACCKVEGLIPIDARGQIVLPKDVRERAGIKAGDKLAVIAFESEGNVCCISLIKAEVLADTVKGTLGPMMSGILQS